MNNTIICNHCGSILFPKLGRQVCSCGKVEMYKQHNRFRFGGNPEDYRITNSFDVLVEVLLRHDQQIVWTRQNKDTRFLKEIQKRIGG